MDDLNKNNVDTLLKYYESARQEILSRITSRDNSLLIYLGGVGAIMSVAFQAKDMIYLLVIPFIALGIAPIIAHHHSMVGALALYCSKELTPYFTKYGIEIPSWDISRSRMSFVKHTIMLRYLGDIVLVCMPAVVSIFANINNINGRGYILVYIAGIVCVVLILIIMIKSLKYRLELFSQMNIDIQEAKEPKE